MKNFVVLNCIYCRSKMLLQKCKKLNGGSFMKKLTKCIAAALAAAIMTVSAAGTEAFALAPIYYTYTGWLNGDKTWVYCVNDIAVAGKNYEIDGILYSFAEDGSCTGKYSGWTKQDGVKRRYSEGLPYTGWLKNKDGSKKYCLDGYLVTGNFQIGNKIYSFGKDGIYTGKSKKPKFTASCESRISADMKKISVTVRHHGGKEDKEYITGEPTKMERWENGKWVDCIGEAAEYAVNDIAYVLGKSDGGFIDSAEVHFSPKVYMGIDYDMPLGYYRITVNYGESGNYLNTEKNLYAVFEVVPPLEIIMSEEVYVLDKHCVDIKANFKVNSERLKNLDGSEITANIFMCDEEGWYPETEIEDEPVPENENGEFPAWYEADWTGSIYKEGYNGGYKTVVKIGDEEYSKEFRVDWVKPREISSCSLKDGNVVVSFEIYNKLDKEIKVRTNITSMESKYRSVFLEEVPDAEPVYKTLKPKEETTVSFNISDVYDTSKLESGWYTIYIDGVGYVDFYLHDN